MKWTLKLERADEACNLHSTTVGHVERPELTSEADLGLAHEDGEYLIRQLQAEIALDQPGLCSQSPTQGAGSRVRLASASPAACSDHRRQLRLRTQDECRFRFQCDTGGYPSFLFGLK